jgi:putative tryptophan/tyrosine transport system substrate-binding protein
MAIHIRRREFIVTLGGAAAAWPVAARGQQPLPVVGFLNSGSLAGSAHLAAAFRQGLKETGYVEGQNVQIEYRWAEAQFDRLPALATDLVHRRVSVIAGTTTPAALAAKAATSRIPIVFTTAVDPIAAGLVVSLNRPGGNATGVNNYVSALGAKRLELLHELVPNATVIGMLVENPIYPDAQSQWKDVKEAARITGQQVHAVNVSSDGDFNSAFVTLVGLNVRALLVAPDILFLTRRDQLVKLAARHGIPAIYSQREFVLAGGLIGYGPNVGDGYRQAGIYTGRILKGANPSNLPVMQPTKFELIINLGTAKALGLEIPPKVLALADEVIE